MDYFPSSLGGSSDRYYFFKDFPYPPRSQLFDLYYCGNLGYHLESILNQIKGWRNPEFIEFALHHIATTMLIIFSYYYGYSDIGATVFFLHDLSDIFTPMTKSVGDLKSKKRYVFLPILII